MTRKHRYLTDAERVRLHELIDSGMRHADIAMIMKVSTSTVSNHKSGYGTRRYQCKSCKLNPSRHVRPKAP